VTNVALPGTMPQYSHFYMATFADANTVQFTQTMSDDMTSWLVFTIADDLLRDHPVTQTTRIDWEEGREHFFYFGTDGPDNVRARAWVCGLHPLQIRAVCHHLVATALRAMQDVQPPPEPQRGPQLILPARIVQ